MIVETPTFIIDTMNKFVVRTGRSDFFTFYLVCTRRDGKAFRTVCHLLAVDDEPPAKLQTRAQTLLDVLEAGHAAVVAARKAVQK